MANEASNAAKGLDKLTSSTKSVINRLKDFHSVFESLSSTGNRFDNDMVQMAISAANARMPLDKFAELLKENNTLFTSLGGNVNQGTKTFSEFAKTFHTSGVSENLRQLGFTSTELNEILALQVGFQKSSFDTSVEGQRKAAASAAAFAIELDTLTQLTGQSRKEQEDNLKRLQADMKLESKFRLIAATEGETRAAELKEEFKKNYAQMAAKGFGDLYKEAFATGTTMTSAAQAQFAMTGKAGMAVVQSAVELSKGNAEYSKALQERAQVEIMALQSNKSFLYSSIYVTGQLGEAARDTMKANDAAYHGMKSTMKQFNIAADDIATALGKQRDLIKKEQEIRTGMTSALITSKIQFENALAAFMEKIVGGINKSPELNESLRKFSEQFSVSSAKDRPEDIMKRYEERLKRERPDGDAKNAASQQEAYARLIMGLGGKEAVQEGSKLVAQMVKGGAELLAQGLDVANAIINAKEVKIDVADWANDKIKKAPKEGRATGTKGETGFDVEPRDVHALIHKGEVVLTPEQQKNLYTNIRTDAIADLLHKLSDAQNKSQNKFGDNTITDFKKLAKDITSVTNKVEVTNWPANFGIGTQVASTKKEEKKDDQKEEKKYDQKDTAKITENDARKIWEDKQREIEKQVPTQSSVRAIDNKIDQDMLNSVPSLANLFIKDQADELETAAEQFKGVFSDLIPIQELETSQEEFKSKFTEAQKRLIEEYKNSSEENRFFAAEEQRAAMEDDLKLLQQKNAEIERLTEARNQRELTEEEEAHLAEEIMNRDALRKLVEDRQDHIDVIENIEQMTYDRDLEKQVENARAFAEQKAKAQNEELESLGGITDAALRARDEFLNQLDSSFLEDEYGEGGEAIGGELDSAFTEDEYGEGGQLVNTLDDLTEQIHGLKEFEEDEYGAGGEPLGGEMDPAFAEDEYAALENLTNQIQGLSEFEEDEYGAGGEPLGGEMDPAFAEDEDDYVSQALKDFSAQLPETMDSMASDAAYAAGPGDASVAGIDFANDVSTQSNNFVDYTSGPPSSESNFSPISMNDFTIGPDGMPIPKPRADAKTIPGAVKKDENQSDAETKRLQRQNDDKKKSKDDKKANKETATSGEKQSNKNLDDVVRSLDSLNSSVGRLIQKVEETSKQEVNALKSLDGNLYKR